MIEFLQLPPLLGRTDEQLQESLDAKRVTAIRWMRERRIPLIADPKPLAYWRRRLTTEGQQ